MSDEVMELLLPELEPRERVLWTGRPQPGQLFRQSLSKGFFVLFFTGFMVLWICAVVQGGHNNWDQGKTVRPFARHNVLIAMGAGLWMLPPGLYMLLWPVREWWKGRGTIYALTDRRALIIRPGFFARREVLSFPRASLTPLRCDARADGSGNLVFENRKSWVGTPRPEGFLAVEHVRELEGQLHTMLGKNASSLPDSSIPSGSQSSASTFRLPLPARAMLVVFTVALSMGTLIIAARVLIVPLVLMLGILPSGAASKAFGVQELAPVLCLSGFIYVTGRLVQTPVEITIGEDRSILFKSWFLMRSVPVSEILSIKTGGWMDTNCFQAEIRHRQGRIHLINQFPVFREFLVTVKALNPAVEIQGF